MISRRETSNASADIYRFNGNAFVHHQSIDETALAAKYGNMSMVVFSEKYIVFVVGNNQHINGYRNHFTVYRYNESTDLFEKVIDFLVPGQQNAYGGMNHIAIFDNYLIIHAHGGSSWGGHANVRYMFSEHGQERDRDPLLLEHRGGGGLRSGERRLRHEQERLLHLEWSVRWLAHTTGSRIWLSSHRSSP